MSVGSSSELAGDDWRKRTALGTLECTDTDCDNNLHAFRLARTPKRRSYRNETCIECDFDNIDWNRLDKRNIRDVDYTISALNYEMIRNYYWGNTIETLVAEGAVATGLKELRSRARKRLEKVIGPPIQKTYHGGYTPWGGSIVNYAQHGTATCCRRCLEEWHGVHRDTNLSGHHLDYFTELVLEYVGRRVPSVA